MTDHPRPDRAILRGIELFQGLDAPAEEDVLQRAHLRRVARGETVFREGEAAHSFFALVNGGVRAQRTTESGEKVVLHMVAPGEFFGCVALTGGTHYPGTAEAVTESVVISWDLETLRSLMARHPGIAAKAFAGLGQRLTETHERVTELQTERAERRLAHALLRLARHSGKREAAGVRIGFAVTRQDLAELAGVTLYTASRTLSAWESEGLITSERSTVTILKPHALVAIAEELGDPAAKKS